MKNFLFAFFKKCIWRVSHSKWRKWAAILQGGDQGEEELTGSGEAAASLLTLPGGEVRRVQRSRTHSGSPLLAPVTWLTRFLPLGTRAGGVPGAKMPLLLPLAPPECLSHPSTSHWQPANTVGRLGPQGPKLQHNVIYSFPREIVELRQGMKTTPLGIRREHRASC